jgi:hypothetical protein
VLAFKGGTMEGRPLTVEEIEAISRLPALEVLHGQVVGVLASPLTGLVRGLGSMISGLAIQLEQIREQGLVGGDEKQEPPAETPGDEEPAEQEGEGPPSESAADHEQQEGEVTETTPEGGGETPPEPAASEAGEAAEEAVEQEASAEEARSDAPGDPVAEGEAAEAEETDEKEG